MFLIESLANHKELNLKLTLMYFIEIICEFAFDDKLLMTYSGVMETIFQAGLQDEESNQVKVASLKTLTIFLSSISEDQHVKKFEGVLSILLSKSIELIKLDQ